MIRWKLINESKCDLGQVMLFHRMCAVGFPVLRPCLRYQCYFWSKDPVQFWFIVISVRERYGYPFKIKDFSFHGDWVLDIWPFVSFSNTFSLWRCKIVSCLIYLRVQASALIWGYYCTYQRPEWSDLSFLNFCMVAGFSQFFCGLLVPRNFVLPSNIVIQWLQSYVKNRSYSVIMCVVRYG